MNEFFSDEIAARVVGVIDLKAGQAVHAVAGRRDEYGPVMICNGDAVSLARHYQAIGVRALYIADLDAIAGGALQSDLIASICEQVSVEEVLVDIGWMGDSTSQRTDVMMLADSYRQTRWIAATESARQTGGLRQLVETLSPARVYLGLDYRGGRLLSDIADEATWIQLAVEMACRGVVVLDLAAVGVAQGPVTAAICQRIRQQTPALQIHSGGGVRTAADVRTLVRSGVDRCLVATALLTP